MALSLIVQMNSFKPPLHKLKMQWNQGSEKVAEDPALLGRKFWNEHLFSDYSYQPSVY